MTDLAIDWSAPRPSAQLARRLASVLPALILAYPMLLSPLIEPEPRLSILSDFEPAQVAAGSSALTRIVFVALGALASAILVLARPRATLAAQRLVLLLGIFLVLALGSTLWSLGPDKTFAMAAYQGLILITLITAATCTDRPQTILSALFWVMVATALANLAAVLARPPGPIGHEGIYGHKNTLGANGALTLFFGLYGLLRGRLVTRLFGLVTVIASMVLLLSADSKTALGLAVLVPVLAVPVYGLASRAGIAPLVAILFGALLLVLAWVLASALFDLTLGDLFLALFNDETFTGRTHIWAFSFGHVLERPWLGHGYQGFWEIGPASPKFLAERAFIAKMPTSHNGFLDMVLELGLVGALVLAAILLAILGSLGRLRLHSGALFYLGLCLVIFALGRNMMESDWFAGASPAGMLFVLIGLVAANLPTPGSELDP